MGAKLIEQLTAQGFTLAARDGLLVVSPKHKLSDESRVAIRQHKTELLALLSRRASEGITSDLPRALELTKEVFSHLPKPQPNDGLSPNAREALGIIRKISARGEVLDALAAADAMQVAVSAITGALAELEVKRLIHPSNGLAAGSRW